MQFFKFLGRGWHEVKTEQVTVPRAKCRTSLHEVSSEGLIPSVGHAKEISDLEEPSNLTELLRFLGLMNFFSDFIPGLELRACPMYEVLIGTGFNRKKPKRKICEI